MDTIKLALLVLLPLGICSCSVRSLEIESIELPDTAPILATWFPAEYSEELRLAEARGVVEVKALVLPSGNVGEVEVVGSSHITDLDMAALNGASRCLFLPAVEDSRPESAYVSIRYAFPSSLSRELPSSEDTVNPSVRYWARPKYPEAAMDAHLEGTVVVKVLVLPDGTPGEVKIHESSGNLLFDDAAIAAARISLFYPGVLERQKVQSWLALPFNFRLRD